LQKYNKTYKYAISSLVFIRNFLNKLYPRRNNSRKEHWNNFFTRSK